MFCMPELTQVYFIAVRYTYNIVGTIANTNVGEHQMELLDCVAAKFHEEPGVFKLLVRCNIVVVVIDCLAM